jgi:multidrug resistance efflux pump
MAGEVADGASRWRRPSSAQVWRWVRILAGIALLAIGLWSLGPQFVFRVTREARINARVIPVHAPIEGQVVVPAPAPGTPLTRGDIATVIANPALDRGRYEQLVTERAMLGARIDAADRQLAELAALRREFDERLERFRVSNPRRSELRIREAQAALEVATSIATERHDEFDRKRNLGSDGVASPAAVLARAEVRVPSTGILWQSLVDQGTSVGPTTELFTLIDCTELVVTAKYSERYFESILPGQRARVQLLGGSSLEAVVESVRGLDVSSADDRLAARMMDLAEGEFLVTLRLDAAKLRDRKAAFCQVGRSVEVVLAAEDGAFAHLTQLVAAGLDLLTHTLRQAVAHESAGGVEHRPLSGS